LEDETTFRNLYQFYLYEFSIMVGFDTNYGGQFPQDDLDGCWTDSKRRPFLVKVDGKWAGLAIVEVGIESYHTDSKDVVYMSEFFIMGAYQKKGIGERVATYLFDHFPGKWEVSEIKQNVNALAFWRKIIGRYTGDNYREKVKDNGTIVQLFENTQ
jgi:predicted acetyltransferase